MSQDVIDFYDNESVLYSKKRYVDQPLDYTQWFFGRRWKITANFLDQITKQQPIGLTLLDIACADGVITKKIAAKYRDNFSTLVGVDISPQMITVAQNKNRDRRISFFSKADTPAEQYDIVLGLGFISGAILASELEFAKDHLKPGGFYIFSSPGRYSIRSLLTIRHKDYYQGYWPYRRSEALVGQSLKLIKREPYGLYVPGLWRWSALARLVQPMVDGIFRLIFPGLCHEKIYLCKKSA